MPQILFTERFCVLRIPGVSPSILFTGNKWGNNGLVVAQQHVFYLFVLYILTIFSEVSLLTLARIVRFIFQFFQAYLFSGDVPGDSKCAFQLV